MAEEDFFQQKTIELEAKRQAIINNVIAAKARLQAQKRDFPDRATKGQRESISRTGASADVITRELSILRGLKANVELAQREGRTVSPIMIIFPFLSFFPFILFDFYTM